MGYSPELISEYSLTILDLELRSESRSYAGIFEVVNITEI